MLAFALAAALALPDPVSEPISVAAQPAPLHGTLLKPEGSARAVGLIIVGSGPNDRNGDAPQVGLRAGSYRLLAEALADHGIATVRYDKRGVGQSAAAMVAEEDLRFETYVEDARSWAHRTAEATGAPCVWLIGHSEGAQIAVEAVRDPSVPVCGLVLLSGAGRSASVVLREQIQAGMPEPLRSQALAAIDELSAGRTIASPPGLEALFRSSVQPYVISWLNLDPAEALAAYQGPVMIGQGTTDIQISVTDAQTLHAARPDSTLVVWEGVNHLLKMAPAERMANAATYGDPDLPLADMVAKDVADFILSPR